MSVQSEVVDGDAVDGGVGVFPVAVGDVVLQSFVSSEC